MYLEMPANKPKSREEIISYLKDHFKYDTMNSWNKSTSYAHRIKIRDLNNVDRDLEMACYEMIDVQEAFDGFVNQIYLFHLSRDEYCISQNGRSGGYLVLMNDQYPGRSIDMGEDFERWSIEGLQERCDLVWDFDNSCEDAVAEFVDFAQTHTVEEKTIMIPKKIMVAVPKEICHANNSDSD
jgi:hypothetical protein